MVIRARHIYEFGPFRLIPEERQLLRGEQAVPLTPKSFELLVVLVENSGHLIGKGELMKRIWPDSFVEEANLSVNMSALRRALDEDPNEQQYVETVPRRGYRFVAGVKESWDDGTQLGSKGLTEDNGSSRVPDSQRQASSPAPEALRTRLSFGRWPFFVIGLLALSTLLLGLNAAGLRQRLQGKINPIQIQSLAVLPLENLSG